MDRAWLHEQLAAGRSIESLAREVGKDPSTVAYWVAKYGLTSAHAPKHAARGGIAREDLEELVLAGLSVRAIGEQLGVSYATVRHWLQETRPEDARAAVRPPHGACDRTVRARRLPDSRRGTMFVRRVTVTTAAWPAGAKPWPIGAVRSSAILVEEAGGACRAAGMTACLPRSSSITSTRADKTFAAASGGASIALDAARAEVAQVRAALRERAMRRLKRGHARGR